MNAGTKIHSLLCTHISDCTSMVQYLNLSFACSFFSLACLWKMTSGAEQGRDMLALWSNSYFCKRSYATYSISSKTSFGGTYLFLSTTTTKPLSQNFGMVVSMIRKVFLFFIFLLKKKKKLHRIFGIVVSFKFNIIKT